MDLLLSVSLRALIPAAVAGAVLAVGRVKAAAARHAVWSVAMAGMSLCLVSAPVLPPVPVRVLPAVRPAVSAPVTVEVASAVPAPAAAVRTSFSWQGVAAAIYGAGVLISLVRLAFGYGFTRRLVRESRRIDQEICESSWISVPMTVGWLRPTILLPADWRDWDEGKLGAVLSHERAHVQRADWAVAGLAAVNRSLFWFHPLAWWLERALSILAEQACDDAAVLETGSRARYAQVLLDMATAVRNTRGRVVWEAMAMAKAAEVHVRIDRILDQTRQIPLGLNRRWRMGLLACSLPLVYAVAVIQVAPGLAQEQAKEQKQTAPAPAKEPAAAAPETAPKATAPPRVPKRVVAPQAAAPVQAPAPEPAPAPSQVEVLTVLTPVTRVEPVYPKIAQQTGAKGTVEMLVTVGTDGHVKTVKALRGHPMLMNAAVDAVKQWVYSPQPAEGQTVASVTFESAEAGRGSIQQAVLVWRKEPVYPEEAKRAGITGVVTIRATIGKDGRVSLVRVLRGDPLLAPAAEEAVRQWVYKPTLLNGTPVETETQVMLNFVGDKSRPDEQTPSLAGAFQPAKLISRKEPVHPGGDLQGTGGAVTFRARVGVDGRLSGIQVVDGPAELVAAALEAVKQWVYRPAKANGQPVEADTQFVVKFAPGR